MQVLLYQVCSFTSLAAPFFFFTTLSAGLMLGSLCLESISSLANLEHLGSVLGAIQIENMSPFFLICEILAIRGATSSRIRAAWVS